MMSGYGWSRTEFCSGLVKDSVLPFYKSQAIPDNKEANILTVVGKTIDDLVLHNSKNILLEVHTPWCLSCETTSKQVEELAKHFKGLDSLVCARIDASANEHPHLQNNTPPNWVGSDPCGGGWDGIKCTNSRVSSMNSLYNKKASRG